jgi:tetratricopeptide (TPR) repeat protein
MSTPPASREAFTRAIDLIARGEVAEAEAVCRAVVERNPDDVNMTGLLGAILTKTRRHEEAEHWLRRTIERAPAFAKPYEDLGHLCIETGRAAEAVTALERAVKLDPGVESAQFALGKALAMLGRGAEADAAFERSFALSPERGAMAVAAEHHREGRLKEAEIAYREVLRRNARNVDAIRLLGVLAFGQSHADDAERLLRRAIELAPDFAGAWLDLGRVLKEQDRYVEALECFARVLAIEPGSIAAMSLRAATLAMSGSTTDAIAAYEAALARRPDHAASLLGLAHVLKAVGRIDEAIEAYRRCAALKPDNGEVYWSLANLKTYRFPAEEIATIETRIADPAIEESSRVNFQFALAKAREDAGDYDEAFRLYAEANRRQRALVSYDPVQAELMNDRIIGTFTADFLREHAGAGHPDASPIFILGLPRSGSTLIEQILASHSRVEGTSELPYVGRLTGSLSRNRSGGVNYPEAVRELQGKHLHALGLEYLERAALHRTLGRPYFIDKMPNNFPSVGFIHLILPNAKVIDARRHPLDACLSCYRQHFAKGQTFTYDLTELGQYYLEYQRLMDHWHAALPGRVLTVQYEELVGDLEGQVRRMLDYCGLPWEDACLRFHETDRPVRTPSAEQVRQPVYTGAVGYWRRYEAQLAELIEVLEPILPRYAGLGAPSGIQDG